MLFEISNYKTQNTNKSQIPMTKTIIRLEFEFWNLFVIWNLIFDNLTQN